MAPKLRDFSVIESRYSELNDELSKPEVFSDRERYTKLSRDFNHLSNLHRLIQEQKKAAENLIQAEQILRESSDDDDLLAMAESEVEELTERISKLDDDIQIALIPPDPNNDRNAILEIRAGTGGNEAALFAGDLFRMYSRYAEANRWRMIILSRHDGEVGGFKEIICLIEGQGAYGRLKYESGGHRVQRVPDTEAQGRIHTSAVTVAILAEAEEVDIDIPENDLRIDVFRSSGPGGQSVNTTDSAVRVTHLPTGLIVSCQDEKSQHKNKAKALMVMRSRLLELKKSELDEERSSFRKQQVGSGDRSEKIRTYNFPQGRFTDHRVGLTIYNLPDILDGDLDEIFVTLDKFFKHEDAKAVLTGAK